MIAYVDALMHSGWQRHGRPIQHCHVFSDTEDRDELHAIAQAVGLKARLVSERRPHAPL